MSDLKSSAKPARTDYITLLDKFRGLEKPARDCVKHLEELGFSRGQARNAVYRFRRLRGIGAAKVDGSS